MRRRGAPPIAQSSGDIAPGIIQTRGARRGSMPIRPASSRVRCWSGPVLSAASRRQPTARPSRTSTSITQLAETVSQTAAAIAGQRAGTHWATLTPLAGPAAGTTSPPRPSRRRGDRSSVPAGGWPRSGAAAADRGCRAHGLGTSRRMGSQGNRLQRRGQQLDQEQYPERVRQCRAAYGNVHDRHDQGKQADKDALAKRTPSKAPRPPPFTGYPATAFSLPLLIQPAEELAKRLPLRGAIPRPSIRWLKSAPSEPPQS